jgi:hypothetical protein
MYKLHPPADADADWGTDVADLPFWTKQESNTIDWCQFNCISLDYQKVVTNGSFSILENILDLIGTYVQGGFKQGENDNST